MVLYINPRHSVPVGYSVYLKYKSPFLLALHPTIVFFLTLSVRVRVVKRSLLNFLL
ncbi:MAG: Uncharacterised protein [Opitutia bacterium UBA7350]|nr:MAG: Uncharacterised protein [Opitutae bacterium UBA7350]